MRVTCPTCARSVGLRDAAWSRCAACRSMVFEPRGGPAVLVAHDAEPIAVRIALVLVQHGMTPLHAPHSDAASRLFDSASPRAAVLDVALSGIMSFQLIERVRNSSQLARIPIVLVASVFNRTAYKRRPTSLYGADDYIEQHHIHDFLPQKLCRMLSLPEPRLTTADASLGVAGQDTRTDLQGGERVRALAHSIVADIALYHQEEIGKVAQGAAWPALGTLLDEGRRLLADMVQGAGPVVGDPIREAFDDMMADLRGDAR